jgi:hypothetical protein
MTSWNVRSSVEYDRGILNEWRDWWFSDCVQSGVLAHHLHSVSYSPIHFHTGTYSDRSCASSMSTHSMMIKQSLDNWWIKMLLWKVTWKFRSLYNYCSSACSSCVLGVLGYGTGSYPSCAHHGTEDVRSPTARVDLNLTDHRYLDVSPTIPCLDLPMQVVYWRISF